MGKVQCAWPDRRRWLISGFETLYSYHGRHLDKPSVLGQVWFSTLGIPSPTGTASRQIRVFHDRHVQIITTSARLRRLVTFSNSVSCGRSQHTLLTPRRPQMEWVAASFSHLVLLILTGHHERYDLAEEGSAFDYLGGFADDTNFNPSWRVYPPRWAYSYGLLSFDVSWIFLFPSTHFYFSRWYVSREDLYDESLVHVPNIRPRAYHKLSEFSPRSIASGR